MWIHSSVLKGGFCLRSPRDKTPDFGKYTHTVAQRWIEDKSQAAKGNPSKPTATTPVFPSNPPKPSPAGAFTTKFDYHTPVPPSSNPFQPSLIRGPFHSSANCVSPLLGPDKGKSFRSTSCSSPHESRFIDTMIQGLSQIQSHAKNKNTGKRILSYLPPCSCSSSSNGQAQARKPSNHIFREHHNPVSLEAWTRKAAAKPRKEHMPRPKGRDI